MNALTTTRPRRWVRTFALALGMLAAFVLLAAAGARAANYVGLGDSYAAGPLIPNQSLNPLGCLRSDHNYAHDAAPGIGLTLRDASCSGATTVDMTQPQEVEFGTNPPQFNSLDANTTVVSVTIGGNDIGFAEVAESCITINPFSHPCLDKYDPGGKDRRCRSASRTFPTCVRPSRS